MAMVKVLEPLISEAKKTGWASGLGSLNTVRLEAAGLSLTEVPNRRGEPPVTTLRPLGREEARKNSLSARFGKGEQPLHNDGAHMEHPPDFVVLGGETTSGTPTRLWINKYGGAFCWPPQYVLHGIFLVQNGRDSFYSPAFADGRYRYDPGCMIPCDARAREAVKFFEGAADSAVEHHWDAPGKLLVIDNRRTLHARASAADDPDRAIQRVSFRVKGEQ
ncbi:TauD/TfdA family dioxygenase [Streptomyces sp. AC04842]|uniref:TauD/TfdA family dioxygenase n=1 Tax=Streptomyces sp. AC04842 TaxID=2775327 RepID=UPI0020C5E15B|nr:TauD/TfdA family dioxygenase [Streptomyces sp. AC04842]